MRKYVFPSFIFILVILTGQSCIKQSSCSPRPASSEAADIQAYALANGINASPHPSGLYYEIVDPGTGTTPVSTSSISITYTGRMLDGTLFDERITPNNTPTDPPWPLIDLIEGWRVGIPLINEGGHIKLIVPSSMAYGCTGYGTIPGNAILFFDIQLVDVI